MNILEGPNEQDWKGRALRAEAAMDFAARMVSGVLSGDVIKEADWAVQRYLEAVEEYRLFRYGRRHSLTMEELMARIDELKASGENGEGIALAFDMGICYDCGWFSHDGPCAPAESLYAHGAN